MTTRRMTALVAILGAIFGVATETRRRQERFQTLCGYHWRKHSASRGCLPLRFDAHDQWHAEMSRKYGEAATHPWFPVAPDLPAPIDVRIPPCLCVVRLPSNHPDAIIECLEREGWNTYDVGEYPDDGDPYLAQARRGDELVEARGADKREAWQNALNRVRAFDTVGP